MCVSYSLIPFLFFKRNCRPRLPRVSFKLEIISAWNRENNSSAEDEESRFLISLNDFLVEEAIFNSNLELMAM